MRPRSAYGKPVGAGESGYVRLVVDGRSVAAIDGQSLAGALHAIGLRAWRRNPVSQEPRAPYCGMGVCFECEVTIDGTAERRACMTDVADGMVVTTEMMSTLSEGQPRGHS